MVSVRLLSYRCVSLEKLEPLLAIESCDFYAALMLRNLPRSSISDSMDAR